MEQFIKYYLSLERRIPLNLVPDVVDKISALFHKDKDKDKAEENPDDTAAE